MADLDILRELVREDTLVSAESDANGRSVLVLEEKKAEPAYAVTILNVPEDTVEIKADAFPPPAFKGSRGERKRADLVVFSWTPGENSDNLCGDEGRQGRLRRRYRTSVDGSAVRCQLLPRSGTCILGTRTGLSRGTPLSATIRKREGNRCEQTPDSRKHPGGKARYAAQHAEDCRTWQGEGSLRQSHQRVGRLELRFLREWV